MFTVFPLHIDKYFSEIDYDEDKELNLKIQF